MMGNRSKKKNGLNPGIALVLRTTGNKILTEGLDEAK